MSSHPLERIILATLSAAHPDARNYMRPCTARQRLADIAALPALPGTELAEFAGISDQRVSVLRRTALGASAS
jgi:hypothetical protein